MAGTWAEGVVGVKPRFLPKFQKYKGTFGNTKYGSKNIFLLRIPIKQSTYSVTENSYQTINLQCNIDLIKQIPNPTPPTHTTFQQQLIDVFVLEHSQNLATITSSSKKFQQIIPNVL